MNIKKIQRRIPMGFKKIIPLSFAALSVAGALSACSDSKVVGADEQPNTVAQGSSSSVTPGSSSSLEGWHFQREDAVVALRSVRTGTAVTYSHFAGDADYQTDTVTAHETFDRVAQSILDFDPSIRNAGKNYSGLLDSATYVAMKDEDGLVHGEIIFHGGEHAAERELEVSCGFDYADMTMYEIHFNRPSDPNYIPNTAIKYMLTIDSIIGAEFRKDCALENGELAMDDLQFVCLVKAELKDGVETYKDPYWKKYATYLIESCVSTRKFDDIFGAAMFE
jgi:hypothetical protein